MKKKTSSMSKYVNKEVPAKLSCNTKKMQFCWVPKLVFISIHVSFDCLNPFLFQFFIFWKYMASSIGTMGYIYQDYVVYTLLSVVLPN
jgi:hypothetical protein